jgi:hypothetical protein
MLCRMYDGIMDALCKRLSLVNHVTSGEMSRDTIETIASRYCHA